MDAYHLRDRDYRIKLNQNENPFDLPDALKQEILAAFQSMSWNRYPGFGNMPLVSKLAARLGVAPNQVLVGNGSNELLQTLINVILQPGKRILLVNPTFLIYEQLARVAGAEVVAMEFNSDWSFPVAEIVEKVHNLRIDLCVLCSPNSPTGAVLANSDLEQILQATAGIVLVDEAYYEFNAETAVNFVPKYANLVVTRTFSKAMGLAGLRIGYMLGHREVISEVNKAKLPYNLDIFSEIVAATLLDNKSLIKDNVDTILSERKRLFQQLKLLPGIEVFPSAANFLMIRTPLAAGKLFEQLLAGGLLVRDISGYHDRLKNILRITVGTPAENDALLQALSDIFPGE